MVQTKRAERTGQHSADALLTQQLRIPDVVEKLRVADYEGWVVIEQDTTPSDPTETARNNREYLEGLLAHLPPPADLGIPPTRSVLRSNR